MIGMRFVKRLAAVVALAGMMLVVGCSSKNSTVTGTVKADGKVVTGGRLTFAPKSDAKNPGKTMQATVGKDGTFSVKDVVAGDVTVKYTPPGPAWPEGVEPKPSVEPPASPWKDYDVKTKAVTITGGSMTLDIELTKGGK
jgi:hypothetical protein